MGKHHGRQWSPAPAAGLPSPAPVHFEVGLVQIPRGTRLPPPLSPQAVRNQGSEAGLPPLHCLMGEGQASDQEHLGQIAQAELVTHRSTKSVGNSRKLKGLPVRSLKVRWQAEQRKTR